MPRAVTVRDYRDEQTCGIFTIWFSRPIVENRLSYETKNDLPVQLLGRIFRIHAQASPTRVPFSIMQTLMIPRPDSMEPGYIDSRRLPVRRHAKRIRPSKAHFGGGCQLCDFPADSCDWPPNNGKVPIGIFVRERTGCLLLR